jgi:hypothetical protein
LEGKKSSPWRGNISRFHLGEKYEKEEEKKKKIYRKKERSQKIWKLKYIKRGMRNAKGANICKAKKKELHEE